MFIGFDIGGTKCSVSAGEFYKDKFEIYDKVQIETGRKAPEVILKQLCEIAKGFKAEKINAAGISCGGPLDSKRGIILSPPNLYGWNHVEIVRFFEDKLSVPVGLQNDANACALAEWKFGAGKGYQNLVFLTFGTGLGAGLILDGKLYCGTNDMAGEVGHIRLAPFGPVGYGKSGSFEGFCSGSGIAQIGKSKALEKLQTGGSVSYCRSYESLNEINAKIIAEFADKGYEDAKEVYETCAQKLGTGLSVLIDILNPEIIVIGSIFARSENLLRESMLRVLESECLSRSREVCRIVPTKLGEKIGDYAALAVAENKFREVNV